MGGKKKQLTAAEKRKRVLPLMRHEDRQRSLWLIIGALEVAIIISLLATFNA